MLHGSLRATNDATGEPLHAASEVANNKTNQIVQQTSEIARHSMVECRKRKRAKATASENMDKFCGLRDTVPLRSSSSSSSNIYSWVCRQNSSEQAAGRKQLTVMETQGRSYAHDHEKIASIIGAMGVDPLCALLDSSLSEPEAECFIDEWCCRARKEGLEACE